MLQLLFRKWWVVLLQGILLIILSIYIFQNPVEVLAGISFWCGLLVLAAGVLGIIAWLAADKPEREGMSLFWSILTAAFGLLMLLHLLVTMKTLTVIFGLWMLVTGLLLVQSGWSLKRENSFGWIMVYCRCVISCGGCYDGFQHRYRSCWHQHPAWFAGFAYRHCPGPVIVYQENSGG
jgi:uncharacterized membrane protein HdeD (DUF308 family)